MTQGTRKMTTCLINGEDNNAFGFVEPDTLWTAWNWKDILHYEEVC